MNFKKPFSLLLIAGFATAQINLVQAGDAIASNTAIINKLKEKESALVAKKDANVMCTLSAFFLTFFQVPNLISSYNDYVELCSTYHNILWGNSLLKTALKGMDHQLAISFLRRLRDQAMSSIITSSIIALAGCTATIYFGHKAYNINSKLEKVQNKLQEK